MARMTHKLIGETAYGIALECYDKCASKSNDFFKKNPDAHKWAKAHQIKFIAMAREALAHLLSMPNVSEEEKEMITEALILDRSVPKGKVNFQVNSLMN